MTWSTVYGISRLSAFGQLPASVPASADELVHGAIDQLIAGWQHAGGGSWRDQDQRPTIVETGARESVAPVWSRSWKW